MKPFRIVAVALFALLLASSAFAATKGTTLFGVELSNGTADLYAPYGEDYITAFDHSEVGAQAQLWHFMTNDYAMTFSAGVGMFSETDKPGNGAAVGAPDHTYTQSSYNVRIGGDRVVSVGDRATLFFGPGIEYWSGKAKWEHFSANMETQNVTRISVSGRLGAIMKLSDAVGFSCQIGRKLGIASATDAGRKVSSWPSSFDAAGGLVFSFGK